MSNWIVRAGTGLLIASALGCSGDFPSSDCHAWSECPVDGSAGDALPARDSSSGEAAVQDSSSSPDAADGSLDASGADGSLADAGCTAPLSLDCSGTCVDPTLPAHCGSCTNVCEIPDAGSGKATCTSGTCGLSCSGSTSLDCNGACVDPTTLSNCGSCGNACPGPSTGASTGGAACSPEADGGHQCTVRCSAADSQQCGAGCYATNDVNHCGSCTIACSPPASGNGTATCTGASPTCGVACSTGYHACPPSGSPANCNANNDLPSDTSDPCILSAQFGVFVATTGSDITGNGTPTGPFASVSFALQHLGGTSRIYVCNGSYDDAVNVTAAVGIYGGLSCAGGSWAYVGGKATVTSTSTTGGPALTVNNVAGQVQVQDMAFISQNAVGQGASGYGLSSIAVLVNGSSNVSFARSTLTAGSGASALQTAPAMPSNYSDGATAPSGSANSATTGGAGGTAVCTTFGSSKGGAGGTVGTPTVETGGTGTSNPSATLNPPAGTFFPYDGAGGASGTSGDEGASGTAGTSGAAAAAGNYGSWSGSTWVPSSGGVGNAGSPGQGGGGGGAKGVGGTGGGAGGCGGAGGAGGAGGGASIALASLASTVSLDSGCALVTSTGGAGQPGGPGQPGQGGGGPGEPAIVAGGLGGNGGGGGGGAGGTGGISVCIVYTSPEPTSSAGCTPGGSASTPGGAGAGATGGNNSDGNPGGSSSPGSIGLAGTTTSPLLVP